MQSDQFIGNGYPALQHSSSNPDSPPPFASVGQGQTQILPAWKPRRKRRKKAPKEDSHAANKTLLGLINKNITTMRHLRVTHSKFSGLKESKEAANEEGGLALPGPSASFGGPPEPPDFSGGPILTNLEPLSNINPWSRRSEEDCDIGPHEAENCLHWMGEKVLEHAGFQGRYVVCYNTCQCLYPSHRDIEDGFRRTHWRCFGVFVERRTDDTIPVGQVWKEDVPRGESEIRCVGFNHIYPIPQEIILHTLFESGITSVGDLEQYIQDDVVRYGGRLSELGKKLDNAYQEIVSPILLTLLRSFAHRLTNRQTKAALSTTTHSLAMRLRVKTTPSSWADSPMCLGRIFWVFANLVSPPSSECRASPSRKSFYDRKRGWVPEALYRTRIHYLFLLLVYSPVVPVCPAEANQQNRRHPSHHHLHSSHSRQRGWKTKLLDFCALSSSPVSIPSRKRKSPPKNRHSPPRTVLQRLEILRHPNLHRQSRDSCYSHLFPSQHYHNRLLSNLHSPNHQRRSPFRTMHQTRPRRRWDLSGRLLVGNRRTLRRRNPRRRKTPRCPELAAVLAS